MARLIKNRTISEDDWQLLTLAANDAPESVTLPSGPLLVSLAVWQARRDELLGRARRFDERLGVWLSPADDPAVLAADLDHFSVVGVQFPLAKDGRGYSIANLLRTRFGYRGELRAFGDIGRDHLHYLRRVGFDAFVVSQPEQAIAGLHGFTESYQVSASQPLPLFRRQALNV